MADIRAELHSSIEREREGTTIAEEAARLKVDFPLFIHDAWHVVEPATKFKPGWHIDAIADKLAACGSGEILRLLINIPPRHMKSLTVSVFWPVWLWTIKPSMRFLTASYGSDLAMRDAVKSRRLLQSPWYRARFGDVFSLTGDQNQKTRYENDCTGYRIATSVGGGATGEGGDVVIIDDAHKSDEAASDTLRGAVLNWHDEVITTRFNDPSTGVEIVIMQRLHELDLAGHLIERGGWEHLCLPAEYEPKHPFVWPDDPRKKAGELLWPEHFGPKEMARLKKELGSQHIIAGQLQQRPAPREGLLLKRADWRYYDPELSFYRRQGEFGSDEARELESRIGEFDYICHSWDTSVKDTEHSDFASGGVWGVMGAMRYGLRFYHQRAALNATIEAMLELYSWALHLWPSLAQFVVIERSANGPDAAKAIRRSVQGVVERTAIGTKWARAGAAEPALVGHNCLLPGYPDDAGESYDSRTPAAVQTFVEELASFDLGAHDDQVDMWSSMVNFTREREGGAVMSVPEGHVEAPRFLTNTPATDSRSTRFRPSIRG